MKKSKKLLSLSLVFAAPVLALTTFATIKQSQIQIYAEESPVNGELISSSQSNWNDSTGATFEGNSMKATEPNLSWQTKEIDGNSKVDFVTEQTLNLNPFGDWKFEHLTFSTSSEKGTISDLGDPTTKNSVSLVWGWTNGFAVVELDATGNVIYNGKLGLAEGENIIVPENFPNDAEIMRQFHYYCFDKPFRIVTQMTEISNGVRFDFRIITKSPWGHEIDSTFSYVSTNSSLKGNKYVSYNRRGSGTIDSEHSIKMTMKVEDKAPVQDEPSVPVDKYECKLESGESFVETDTTEGYIHSYEKAFRFEENQEFNVDLFINDEKNSFGYDKVSSFVDASSNEQKYSGPFYSEGNTGKIKINIPGNYKVIVNVNESKEVDINLEVRSYDLADIGTKYHVDASNWVTLYNAEINNSIMSQTGVPSLNITKEFGGNATVKFVLDYRNLAGSWGGVALMVKGQASEFAKVVWSFDGTTNTVVANGAVGSWIALCVTHGGYQLVVCDEGIINVIGTNTTYFMPNFDGLSFWHICEQKTEVVFDVKDVNDGVALKLSFYASGHPQNNGNKYTYETVLPYKSLWGAQSAAMAYVAGLSTPNSTNNQVKLLVTDSQSTFTKDTYHAALFHDNLSKLTYDSITAENFSSITSTYNSLKEQYEALTDGQKALVSNEDKTRLETIQNDLNNIDPLVLAQLSLNKLDGVDATFTRDNYDEKSALINEVHGNYNLLTDEQKAKCDSNKVAKLNELKTALDEYEEILSYADPVVELIKKINLPISNYAKDSRIILAAKKAYDDLYPEEKAEVYNYEILEEAIDALNAYDEAHKIDGYNFVNSKDNLAEVDGLDDLIISDESIVANSSNKALTVYTTKAVENGKEITWVLDSDLQKCVWGNFYFVFRADSAERHHDTGVWLNEGNYTVLLIGGDGFKVVECKNGVIPMTVDAAGNPIADFNTILDYPTDEEGSQSDIHLIYKNYSIVKIKTEDIYEGDEYVGYKATITLTGGESGKTFVREYISTNKDSKDAGYFGFEAYASNPINVGSGGLTIKGIYVEGTNTYDGAAAKAEIANRKAASTCDNLLNQVIVDVNVDNLEAAKTAYENAKAAYEALTDAQKALLTKDVSVLDTAKTNIDKIEESLKQPSEEPSVEPSEEPSDVPSEEPSETPSEDVSTIPSITPSEEISTPSEAPSDKPEPSKKGCKGVATGGISSLFAIIGALILKRKNKK